MYTIITEWDRQKRTGGQEKISHQSLICEWADDVADYIESLLQENPKIGFSGTEDFGTGSCVLYPETLRCRAYGDCRYHYIEAVKQYVTGVADELKPGQSTDLLGYAGGTRKRVSIEIKAF